ncbi:MAG TPA: hypothetical protein PKV67_12830 [Hyphomonas sp.]|nr:hypothetical protein [Hyphomonas sp.]
MAIDKPDHERHYPMHARTNSGKQLSCALFAARHQRLAASIQNKNCHVDPLNVSTACPYGPCYGHFLAVVPLPSAMLQRSFNRWFRSCDSPFRANPKACLLLPLAERRTEEASGGASCTSLQRSCDVSQLGLVNQACCSQAPTSAVTPGGG